MEGGPNFARLIDYWKIQGLAIAKGAGESELEVQDYDSDGNLFAFLSLPRIQSVREECLECFVDETTGNFYVFADFKMWSCANAVEMTSDPCSAGGERDGAVLLGPGTGSLESRFRGQIVVDRMKFGG